MRDYVAQWATQDAIEVLDIGGRDVNGTLADLFPQALFTVLDMRPAPNVDIVADAATWEPAMRWDVVLCTEVFEHTPDWPQICTTAFRALKPGGRFIATCAGPGRPPHSAIEATGLQPGEYYANLDKHELAATLQQIGFARVDVRRVGTDLQGTAVTPSCSLQTDRR